MEERICETDESGVKCQGSDRWRERRWELLNHADKVVGEVIPGGE